MDPHHTKVQLVVRVVWKPQPKGVLATTADERAAVFVATRTLAKILQNTAKRQAISTTRQKGNMTYLAQGQGQAKWWLCGEAPHSTSVVQCGRTVWWHTVVVVRQELSHYLVTGTKWPPPPHCCHYLVRFSIKIKLPTFQLESILRKWI